MDGCQEVGVERNDATSSASWFVWNQTAALELADFGIRSARVLAYRHDKETWPTPVNLCSISGVRRSLSVIKVPMTSTFKRRLTVPSDARQIDVFRYG